MATGDINRRGGMDVRGGTRRLLSSSTLVGDSVVNSQGEDLGKIKDLMIDLHEGCIGYAVLSFGGVMGLGDKLFAVPWSALTLDENKHNFILNISKERLKDAPGFDKDNWPDFANPDFGAQLNTFYGIEPYTGTRGKFRGGGGA